MVGREWDFDIVLVLVVALVVAVLWCRYLDLLADERGPLIPLSCPYFTVSNLESKLSPSPPPWPPTNHPKPNVSLPAPTPFPKARPIITPCHGHDKLPHLLGKRR